MATKMRILIFSDLHANFTALCALQRVEREPDALFFLGDAVGYGPDIVECVAWVKNNATATVQGDHDRAAADGAACASPDEWLEMAHATREVNRAILPNGYRDYLRALPRELALARGGARFLLQHQLPAGLDALTTSDRALTAAFAEARADVIFCGHTHVPAIRRVDGKWIVNPGSLGQPRHGLPSATYAVWEDGDLKIQHIDYDPRPTIQRIALLPLDPEHIARLQKTLELGM